MDNDGPMEFECGTCRRMFQTTLFEISSALERVEFISSDLPTVEVQEYETVAAFCSVTCRLAKLEAVMAAEGVPLPAVRPDIGPVEHCALCRGPVVMTDWHLTYTEAALDFHEGCGTASGVEYLAVLCRSCTLDKSYENAPESLQPVASITEAAPSR